MAEKWTLSNFHHKYVELHVRAAEKVPYLNNTYVTFPEWYRKVWNMPDSAVSGGKNLAYHVGHYTAIGSVLAPLALLVF